jgi:hypothetical protein
MKYLLAVLFFINFNVALACSPNPIPFNLLVMVDGEMVERNDLLTRDFIKEYNEELRYCTPGKWVLAVMPHGDGFFITPDAIGQEECMAKAATEVLQRIEGRKPTISLPSVTTVPQKISVPYKSLKQDK